MAGRLLTRNRVAASDTWDLSSLFESDEAWQTCLEQVQEQIPRFAGHRGKLASSPRALARCLDFDVEVDQELERLGAYAYLKACEDQTDAAYARLLGQFRSVATKAGEATSFLRPEILAIPPETMKGFLKESCLAPYAVMLKRIRRYRRHTLSPGEEKLLAMQGEMAGAAGNVFRKLLDADLRFGQIEDAEGRTVELTHATFAQCLQAPKRKVRKTAFRQYYAEFANHEHTLAETLAASVHKDVYYARARGYSSALHRALFPDQIPMEVYDNLIRAVREQLPAVHHYLEVRRRKLKLRQLHMYDTYVPLVSEAQRKTTWAEATDLIVSALQPLGDEYTEVLASGLKGRWCDRYPNKNKQSGAFSYGTYRSDPYILMNFKPAVFEDVFTLAHEAGHSMHSYLSARDQSFVYYNYTIFVAEVASTFNEELLSHYLLEQAHSDKERAYLLNRNIDAIRGTIVRQTMFAEFEREIHAMAEAGEPLTLEAFRRTYRGLLQDYFGPQFTIDTELELECLRIPHFYRAFYVYKYATGLSAAIALSRRVLTGGVRERNAYLKFLSSGCAHDPLVLLRKAGVDMRVRAPVDTALEHFGSMVRELDTLV